jgi:type III secretion protein N (ATPase)
MERTRINVQVETGVRAIDGLLPIGRGQRIGVFAAAGGGKSTLLATLARQAKADAIVIALIGERGREVREFVEDNLGAEGLARSVVIVATSDRPALERARAAHAATAVAEGLRAQGRHVLLLMDSVTRFGRALREIGLATGEPPVRRGFPPSVFAELPRLFERTGTDATGAITGIYTVLLEDEEDDPIGEEVRSLLDGHVYLSRKLAARGHYPAIDILASQSRLMGQLTEAPQRAAASALRAHLAKLDAIELIVQVGDYKPGQDAAADKALALRADIDAFLRQPLDERTEQATTLALLRGFGT